MMIESIQEDINYTKTGNPKRDEINTQLLLLKLILDELKRMNSGT